MPFRALRHPALLALLVLSLAPIATAGIRARMDDADLAAVRAARIGQEIRLERVPLTGGRHETLVLEPFDVLAPSAVVEFWDAAGVPTRMKPAAMRQFRGSVEGIPESLAYVSVIGAKIEGVVVVGERTFSLRASRGGDALFVEEVDTADASSAGSYLCGVDGQPLAALPSFAWPDGPAATTMNLAVQTDTALYTNLGNDAASVETFARDLIGRTATLSRRGLRTDMRIVYLSIATTTDPWAVNPAPNRTLDALLEYGDYWHGAAPFAGLKSAALLLSGHYEGTPEGFSAGGIAWRDSLCEPAFEYAGHSAGAYAYCGGLGVQPGGSWAELTEVAHEVRHLVPAEQEMQAPLDGTTISAPHEVRATEMSAASVEDSTGVTVDWTIANGTFAGGGTSATGPRVRFTGDADPVLLTMVATNSSGCAVTAVRRIKVDAVELYPPDNVVATATSSSSVTVTWVNNFTATSYDVYRSTDGTNFTKITADYTVTTTPYVDNAVSAGTGYVYKVRGRYNTYSSGDSNSDLTATVDYTDPTITAGSTPVMALHLTQITAAANALRAMTALAPIVFSDGAPSASGPIYESQLTELRLGVDQARTQLSFPAGSYTTDPVITAGTTNVKKDHLDQLRAAVQ